MTRTVFIIAVLLLAAIAGLRSWRASDERAMDDAWHRLASVAPDVPELFDPSMVEDLPPPARRFFLFAIQPGTPIRTVAEIRMHGEIGLGPKDKPGYQPMRARQILAAPFGFIWRVEAGNGAMRFSGSDGANRMDSWSRFWLLGIVPIVRAGGDPDHHRASFGRLIGEAVFWTPAALLPREGVTWSAVDDETASVSVEFEGLTQRVDVTVADDGRPTAITLPRWTNANPDRTFRLQPFGGYLYDFEDIGGYRVPTRVEAGNYFGTQDYFPFFKAVVDDVRFLRPDESRQ